MEDDLMICDTEQITVDESQLWSKMSKRKQCVVHLWRFCHNGKAYRLQIKIIIENNHKVFNPLQFLFHFVFKPFRLQDVKCQPLLASRDRSCLRETFTVNRLC